jgi:hypothetical protein
MEITNVFSIVKLPWRPQILPEIIATCVENGQPSQLF